MTLNEVIQAGKIDVDTSMFSTMAWWAWLLIGLCLLTIFAGLKGLEDGVSTGFMGIVLILMIAATYNEVTVDKPQEDKKIEEWKQQYAIPYIQSLAPEKREIVYVKIDTEIDTRKPLYTYPNPIFLTPLTVSFKANGIETYTNWYEARMELTNEEKPYIEFKRVTSDLGHGVTAGLYDVKVYLPESYKFTDIK